VEGFEHAENLQSYETDTNGQYGLSPDYEWTINGHRRAVQVTVE